MAGDLTQAATTGARSALMARNRRILATRLVPLSMRPAATRVLLLRSAAARTPLSVRRHPELSKPKNAGLLVRYAQYLAHKL